MDHYYSKTQTSDLRITKIEVMLLGKDLVFNTGSGVFCIGKVDKGSEILIKKARIPKQGKILDLGCGYGVVGIALNKAYPKTEITFSDVNSRAIKLTRMNCKENKIKAKFVNTDGYEKLKDTDFDTILLNPPQSAGRDVCIKLINESINYLKIGGTLQLVVRNKKGGSTLSEYMEDAFGNLEIVEKKAGYWIYLSTKKD